MIAPKPVIRTAPLSVRKAREQSLSVRGVKVFNLRSMNTDHVDTFKNHLDTFLSSVPDQPTVTGLGRAALTNSLLDQLPQFYVMTNQ